MDWDKIGGGAAIGGLPGAMIGAGGGLGPLTHGIGGFLRGDDGSAEYQAALDAIREKIDKNWTLPDYDKTPLTPQEFQLLSVYQPQIAAFVQQQQPQLVPDNAINQGTQAQSQALDELGQLAKTGTDSGMQAQLEEAQMSADQALRSNRANALASLASRGLGSSGATLTADIDTSLAAADSQRRAAVMAAQAAAQRKAQAISSLGQLGGQVAGEKQQAQEFNANTANQYDQIIANRRQQYENYLADTQNNANLMNQQNAQNVSNMNTGLRNQYQQYNQQRKDRITTDEANAKNDKLKTLLGLETGGANQRYQTARENSQSDINTFLALAGIGAAAATSGAGGGQTRSAQAQNPSSQTPQLAQSQYSAQTQMPGPVQDNRSVLNRYDVDPNPYSSNYYGS